ncbi:acetyl-coenzyme A transporter 1-like isoform X2 [Lycorma delicatula]|uniref:acetyl-coenzyme A transporter 1-like isoform X2 n=1 Tax=Lycorma delicatula TaxID=130591 RepID=UPI003F51A113
MNNHTDYAERFRKRIKNIENLKSLGPRKSVSQHNLISVIGKKTNATWIDDDDDNDDDDDDDDDDNEDDDYDAETFVDAEEINTNFVSSFFADKYNILLLLLLNTLQSIPVGLSASIPFLLKSRSSYAEQAQFSLSSWPFHLRLLWAPFIEHSHVIKKFERRKSWLILTQYLIGLNMLYLSHKVNSWLNNGEKCEINLITIFFLILNFLSASQDMAISGWALAVLKKRNASYLSTCSRIGNLAGYFIGHVLFLLLESPNFCNSYLRSKHSSAGIVSLEAYLFTTSWIFIFCTTFFAIFKKENHVISPNEAYCLSRNYCPETVQENYNILFSILKLKPVYSLILMLLMSAVGFAVCESITPIKLLEAGVTIEDIAVVKSMNILVQLFLPLLFSNYTTDRITVHSYFVAYSFR